MPLPALLNDVVDEASGRSRRRHREIGASAGPAGNARLTAWTGLILLALVAAQLVTLLDVGRFISWHVVIGTLLVPFALLKTTSTTWRMVRYYSGHGAYRSDGPPVTLLRVLGPLVVVSTLALLGTGLTLVALGPNGSRRTVVSVLGQQISALTVHQAVFFAFATVTGSHLLARLVPAIRLVGRRPSRSDDAGRPAAGRRRRMIVLMGTAVVAAVTSVLVLSAASGWRHDGEPRPPGHGIESRSRA